MGWLQGTRQHAECRVAIASGEHSCQFREMWGAQILRDFHVVKARHGVGCLGAGGSAGAARFNSRKRSCVLVKT